MTEERAPCPGCSTYLMEPYIQCAVCGPPSVLICLHCFARGLEFDQHQNNHSYEVIKNDFSLFEPGWTAAEEVQLLESLAECGMSNWSDVAQQLRTKNKFQCESHYNKYYLENRHPSLPVCEEPDIYYQPSPVIFKLSEDPPRPAENSAVQIEMSGYMAARGDFMTEYDNFAEMDLRDIDFEQEEEEDYETDVKFAVLDVYLNKLSERDRRKRIIRNHGLINIKKIQVINRRYEKVLGPRFESLKALCQLLPPLEYDGYLESLLYEAELKQDIRKLQEYRSGGVCRRHGGRVYDHLRRRREQEKARRHMLTDILNHLQDEAACQQWLQRQAVIENISKGMPVPLPAPPRKSAPPLDIMNMPGYDRLNDKEKELCSLVRLVPESYLEFKKMLVTECAKLGYLRLAQARAMIKIDVNKTRKIYDFLVAEGDLVKDP